MRSDRALLVAAGGGIGDTLLAGVVAHALRMTYAQVDALVLPAHRTVAEHDPVYDHVHTFGPVAATAGIIRAERYDAAAVTWATLPTALVPFLAGIPRRAGQARRLYSGLFTDRVVVRSETGDRSTHWTQLLLDYARALGCDDPVAQPAFVPTETDVRAAMDVRRVAGVAGSYAIVHPTRGLSAQRSRWPIEGFITLARALREREGLPVLVSGSVDDASIAERIADASGAISIAGATSIGAYAALAERAAFVVAMDSGPMHVAAAVGAPTVGVFALASDEPDRWAPRGPRTAVVRSSYPCPSAHRKETCPDFPCVRDLNVAAILAALDGLRSSIAER